VAVIVRGESEAGAGLDIPNLPVESALDSYGGPSEALIPPGEEDMATLRDPDIHEFGRAVRRLGYNITGRITDETEVVVANYANPRLLQWVRDGGKLLYITTGPSPFYWVQGRGGAYSGGWITSFTWLKPQVHKRLAPAGPGPVSLPFLRVMPAGTLVGLPVEDPAYHDDFLAGMVTGWLRHPTIHTVQFRYGKGKVVMTTFHIEPLLGESPLATVMFHDLLEHLCCEACEPTLVAS
jgi:hypothetical protein